MHLGLFISLQVTGGHLQQYHRTGRHRCCCCKGRTQVIISYLK